MNKLEAIISKLESIDKEKVDQGLLVIIGQQKSELIDRNTRQLFNGRDANDQPLGYYKSDSYAAFKNNLNSAPGFGVMDWHLTGDLYAGWFVDVDRFPVFFGSTDEKFQSLFAQNQDATGLDQNNLEEFRQ